MYIVLRIQRFDFLNKCDFYEFWNYMAQKPIAEETLKTDFGVNS